MTNLPPDALIALIHHREAQFDAAWCWSGFAFFAVAIVAWCTWDTNLMWLAFALWVAMFWFAWMGETYAMRLIRDYHIDLQEKEQAGSGDVLGV